MKSKQRCQRRTSRVTTADVPITGLCFKADPRRSRLSSEPWGLLISNPHHHTTAGHIAEVCECCVALAVRDIAVPLSSSCMGDLLGRVVADQRDHDRCRIQ